MVDPSIHRDLSSSDIDFKAKLSGPASGKCHKLLETAYIYGMIANLNIISGLSNQRLT